MRADCITLEDALLTVCQAGDAVHVDRRLTQVKRVTWPIRRNAHAKLISRNSLGVSSTLAIDSMLF